MISLCQDGESVQYRFGTKEKVEITLPESSGAPTIRVLKRSFATGEEIGVRFIKGSYSYTLSNFFGGKPPEEFDHLVVENAGKQVADLLCSTELPTSGNLREVASTLEGKGLHVDEQ